MLVFAFGLLLIIALYVRKVKGAILISIVATTVLAIIVEAIAQHRPVGLGDKVNPTGWNLNVPTLPGQDRRRARLRHCSATSSCSAPSSAVGVVAALLFVFTLMLADFFDTMGTMTAIGAEAGLLDDGRRARRTPSGSWSSTRSPRPPVAPAGVSSNTSYIESASGVGEGARTGLASRRHRRAVPARHRLRAAGRDHPATRPRSRRWSWSAS